VYSLQSEGSWQDLVRRAEAEIEATIGSLPGELSEEIRALPVVLEPEPTQAMITDGIEADTLGLFIGLRFPDTESGAQYLPAQILIFLENIWLYARGDPRVFRKEVRTTYLHEIGHYLGLEEDDLFERGMQ
jgi:predicted Zn-dependent protease with MMP-like domain